MFNRFTLIVVIFSVFNFTALAEADITLAGSLSDNVSTYCSTQQPLTMKLGALETGIYNVEYKWGQSGSWNKLSYYEGSIAPNKEIKIQYVDLLLDTTNIEIAYLNRIGKNVYFRLNKKSDKTIEIGYVTFTTEINFKCNIYRLPNPNIQTFHIDIIPQNLKDLDWTKVFQLNCYQKGEKDKPIYEQLFDLHSKENGVIYAEISNYIWDIQKPVYIKLQAKPNYSISEKVMPNEKNYNLSKIPSISSTSVTHETPKAENLSQYYIEKNVQPYVNLHIKDEWARAPYKLYKGEVKDENLVAENMKFIKSDTINGRDSISNIDSLKSQIRTKIVASDNNKISGQQVWWEWESYYQQRYNEWEADWCAPKTSTKKNNMAETVKCDIEMEHDVVVMGVEEANNSNNYYAYIVSCNPDDFSCSTFKNSIEIHEATTAFRDLWNNSFNHKRYDLKIIKDRENEEVEKSAVAKKNNSYAVAKVRYTGYCGSLYETAEAYDYEYKKVFHFNNLSPETQCTYNNPIYTYETSNGCLALVKKPASEYDNSKNYYFLRLFGDDYATVNISRIVSQQNVFKDKFFHFGILDGTYQNWKFLSLNEYPTIINSAEDIIETVAYYDGEYIHYQGKSVRQLGVTSIMEAGYDSSKGCYYVEYKIGSQRYRRNMHGEPSSTTINGWKNDFVNQKVDACFDANAANRTLNITTNRTETYTLVDANGGKTEFTVFVPCKQIEPTSKVAQWDGSKYNYSMTLKYLDMGEMVYNNNKISRGETLDINNLKDSGSIQLTRKISDTDSDAFTHNYKFGEGITKVEYTYCDSPGGTIKVTYKPQTVNDKIYLYGKNSKEDSITTSDTNKNEYLFTKNLTGDKYHIEAVSGAQKFICNDINIKYNTFVFNDSIITNATTIEGTGSAIFTVKNAIQNVTWTVSATDTSKSKDYNSVLTINNLPAKQYIVTATQSGCTISDTFNIEAPVVTGRVKVEQVNNEIVVTAKIDSINELVNDLQIELCNNKSNDTLNIKYKPNLQNIIDTIAWAIPNDKNGKNTIKLKYNGDNYWEVCTFTIAENALSDLSLAYTIDTTVPKCFEQDLKFDLNPVESPKKKNFQSNINGKNEGKNFVESGDSYSIANSSINEKSIVAFKVKNDSSATNNVVNGTSFTINYFRSRNDTIDNLYIKYRIVKPISAELLFNDFLCSYSNRADIEISNITGGFFGDNKPWRKGEETLHCLLSFNGIDNNEKDFTDNDTIIGNRKGIYYPCYIPGKYTVKIQDVIKVGNEAHNCKIQQIGINTITRPSPITIENIPTDPICELTANGTIQVEANGGSINYKGYRYYIDTVYIADGNIHYDWTERYDNYGKLLNWNERENRIKRTTDSITYKPEIVKSSQTVTFNSLYPGIYKTIVLDSNNCVQTRTDTLRQYHNPYVTAAHYDSVRCYGEKNGRIIIDSVEGSYYTTYYQLFKCNEANVYVPYREDTINNPFVATIPTDSTPNDRTWKYYADTAKKGIPPLWEIDSLYKGYYNIALTDVNGCTTPVTKRDLPFGKKSGKHFNIPVRQPDSLILSINDENNIIREYGKPGGSVNVNVSGGNKGMFNIYLDSKEDTLTQVIWGNHAFNDIFTPGTHKLYVTDHKECIDSATTKQMRQPDSPLSIEATPHDALCNGSFGSITVRGSGGWNGYQYSCSSKSNLYGANQNEYTFYDIKGGYYEVSVTDAEGVTATQKVYVNTPPKLMAAPQLRASSCKNDGLISANITGGTMPYLVKPDSSSVTPFYFEPYITNSNLTIIPKQLAAGDYSIVVVDSNNCEILMSAVIADSSVKATVKPVYPTAHEFANGRLEAVVQQGPAPYTYQWKNHNTGETCTNAVWDKVGAGVYSLDVTDANNCSVSVPITYLATNGDLPLIIDTIIGETAVGACNGMASFTSDTTGFKSITLHDNSGVEKDITSLVNNKLQFELTGLAPNSYLLECVLADTTVRYAKFTIARYEPMHLIVSNIVDVSKQDAANGSAKLRIDGGRAPFIVQMLRGDDFLADTVLNDRNLPMSGLTAANYTVSVVDESDNRINTQFIIRKPEKPLRLQAQSVENPSCNGYTNGRIILKATGGWGDYEYAAAEGEFGRATAYDGRGAAVHTFVAIDSKGITDTLKVELVEPLPLTARVVQVDSVSCFGLTDGSVTFDIAGGTAPYTVHYDDFFDKKSNFVGSLNAGTHTFNITDSNFCRAIEGSLAVDIPQPDNLQVAHDSVIHTTCNTDNGRIFITIAGGTAPYANSWREDGLIKERFANLTAIDSLQGYSLYEVEVADAKGCKAGKSYRINPSSGPKIERVRTLPVLCHGDSTGTAIIDSADIVPATPYSPFRIEWPHGENAMSVGNLPAGWNVVFVIDSNNCKNSTSFNIDAPSPIEIRKIGSRDASCYGYADGRISTLTLGGVGGYRYLWSNGDTLPDIDSIAKGAYTIVVADRNNCRNSAVFAIGQPDSLHVEIGEENVLMCPDNTYEFIPTDGFKTYRWILNDSTLSDKRNLIASEQGEYHLVATYGANCISRDTVTITIGDDLLEADFYMASDASKDNTIALVELSNMKTDSIRWDFSAADFEVMDSSLYELQLKPNTIGLHNITLWAYSSGCVSYITKQVEISELADTTDNIKLGYDPLIKSVTVKPNPTNGLFRVDVQLRESHDAEMTISSVSHGTQIEQRELTGEAEYSESFDLSNASDGVYILRISASDEHRVLKVLIAK